MDKRLREMLAFMKQKQATDLHLTVGSRPFVRIDGEIMPMDLPETSEDELRTMLFNLLTEEQIKTLNKKKTLDCSFGEEELGRFRVNIYKQRGTIAAALRRIPSKVPTMDELGLPVEQVQSLCNLINGLVLVSGPVGSGKTTTLASMVQYINHTRRCHIITVEDPIEYVHKNVKSIIHQREIGIDTLSFSDALKYGLREDPDVMLVGEMRDLETISSAVTLAETGHLILATLHTSDAGESIRRIVDVFSPAQQSSIITQLSSTLAGVINQQLFPIFEKSGMVLATEILIATAAIRNLIRENKIEHIYSHIQMGSKFGMRTMNKSLYELVASGKITKEFALSRSTRVKELMGLLEKL